MTFFRPSPMLDFQFNTVDQCVAGIHQRTGFNDPMIHSRKDRFQVDYEFSNSRKTFAKIQESSGLKPINRAGVMTDYQESLFKDPPTFRKPEPKIDISTFDSPSSSFIREEPSIISEMFKKKEPVLIPLKKEKSIMDEFRERGKRLSPLLK